MNNDDDDQNELNEFVILETINFHLLLSFQKVIFNHFHSYSIQFNAKKNSIQSATHTITIHYSLFPFKFHIWFGYYLLPDDDIYHTCMEVDL